MANYINKYLRSAGIKAPGDNMTEAQINEQNKANPLASFGFMTAQQKQERAAQQAMYEQQVKMQQDMLQQQLLARMSSQEKIGYYAGSGLMGLMQYLHNRKAAPDIPEAPPTDDPQIQRYNELAAEVGPETAMQILGQEQGNAAMIQQGQQMLQAKQKADLESNYKKSQIANNESLIADRAKEAKKANQVITTQRTGADGKPYQVSMEVMGKDDQGRNIYREIGSAVKGSVTDTNEGFATSKGGVNERTKAMESALTNTANAFDIYDKLGALAKDVPAGTGWTGILASKADTAVEGLRNLTDAVTQADGQKVTATFDLSKSEYKDAFKSLGKIAGASDKLQSLYVQLAYSQAAANGDSSRSISDKDIANQIKAIGGTITNPQTFTELIKQNKELMVNKLDNMAKYTRIDGKPIYDAYRQDIEGLKSRIGMGAGSQADIIKQYGSEENARKRLKELEEKHGKGGTD